MRKIKLKPETVILSMLFAAYLVVLLKITIFRYPDMISNLLKGELHGIRSLNLIPFVSVVEFFQLIQNGGALIGLSNILGNLILFFPLGYMTALLFPNMRKPMRILALSIVLSAIIEGCQYIFASGQTDIDDVMLNALGGMIGYWIYFLTPKMLQPKKYAIIASALMIALTCPGLFIGNNHQQLFQCKVKEIGDDSITVSRIDLHPSKEKNTISTTENDDQLKVAFSADCSIVLVETQPNGKIIDKKTMKKNEIRIDDFILINQFLIAENDSYMVKDIEIHRVQIMTKDGQS